MRTSSSRRTGSKCCAIRQRVVTAIMLFFLITLAYMQRISLSFVITQIVQQPSTDINGKLNTNTSNIFQCPPYPNETSNTTGNSSSTKTTEKFDWSQELQGTLLASFYLGYILTHLPGALLSVKIGGKWSLLLGNAMSTIFTLFTPLAIISGGAVGLIVCRIIVGMGGGIVFPSCSTLLAAWTPPNERSLMVSLVYSGVMVGAIIGSSMSSILIGNYGWPSVFYWFGGVSVVWCLAFYFICYDNPNDHPFISESERDFLNNELRELKKRTDIAPTPWRLIFTSAPMLAIICAQVGHSWGLFIIIEDIPKYMNDVLRFPIIKNGLYSALWYTFMFFIAIATGFLSDFLINGKFLEITISRKLFTVLSGIGPAIFLVLASYAQCDRTVVVVMFTVGMTFMGTYYSGVRANCLDLAPNYAGVVMAIANGLGGMAGAVALYIVGLLTPNSALYEWRVVFWITFTILVASTAVYCIYASGKVQPWNDPLNMSVNSTNVNQSSVADDITEKVEPTTSTDKD